MNKIKHILLIIIFLFNALTVNYASSDEIYKPGGYISIDLYYYPIPDLFFLFSYGGVSNEGSVEYNQINYYRFDNTFGYINLRTYEKCPLDNNNDIINELSSQETSVVEDKIINNQTIKYISGDYESKYNRAVYISKCEALIVGGVKAVDIMQFIILNRRSM